jgi:hypothetical protein
MPTRKKRENSTIFVLFVVVAAVCAAIAHVHIDGVAGESQVAADVPVASSAGASDEAAADSVEWDGYSPAAHCGLGNGLHDITAH